MDWQAKETPDEQLRRDFHTGINKLATDRMKLLLLLLFSPRVFESYDSVKH